MNKIYVFDLDGTLLNSNKVVSERNIQAIKDLHDSGAIIIIATGRPEWHSSFVLNYFPFKIYAIFDNGAHYSTFDNHKNFISIPNKKTAEIIEYLNYSDPQCILSVNTENEWLTNSGFDFAAHWNLTAGPEIVSDEILKTRNCSKILLFNCSCFPQLYSKFSSDLNLIQTDNGEVIQIMARNVSKENAVKEVVQSFGLSMSDVTCFGDDFNDLDLFKVCGESVAMFNAIPELKKISTHVTKSNDEDGVADFLENQLLSVR